jgi:hypothetical protein
MVKAIIYVILLLISTGQDILVSSTNSNGLNVGGGLSIFDPEFQVRHEEMYGITSDEYMQYIIPQQFIVGFNETVVSDTINIKQYIHAKIKSGGFVNATALWYYQTTTFVGVTIAGVDDALYTALELDPNVVFIEPVSGIRAPFTLTSNLQRLNLNGSLSLLLSHQS